MRCRQCFQGGDVGRNKVQRPKAGAHNIVQAISGDTGIALTRRLTACLIAISRFEHRR